MKTLSLSLALALIAGSTTGWAKDKKPTPKTDVTQETTSLPTKPDLAAPAPQNAPVPSPVVNPSDETLKPESAPTAAPAETPIPANEGRSLYGLHAAFGLPHPYTAGFNYVDSSKLFSAEINFGSYSTTLDGVDAKMSNIEAGLRWHPFAGSFFVGADVGTHTITAEKTETILGQAINAKADVKANYVSPKFGWLWGGASAGFFWSMDFGALVPLNTTVDFTTNADATIKAQPDYATLDNDVHDQGKKLGETTLPLWTLIKIGWLF